MGVIMIFDEGERLKKACDITHHNINNRQGPPSKG